MRWFWFARADGNNKSEYLYFFLTVLTIAGVLLSTGVASAGAPEAKIKVFVSVLPQSFFVERVGGPFVETHVFVGPGASPHHFEPTPRQAADLSDAVLYFRTGIPFEEGLVKKISGADAKLKIVDLREGITLLKNEDEDEDEPAGSMDPHVWMDPKLAKIQSKTICEALKKAFPEHAAEFEKNLTGLLADLNRVDAKITETLKPFNGKEFFVYHPAFGYFGRSYGLRQVSIEEEGKEPGAKQIARIIESAKKRNVKVIFVQPQFSQKSAGVIAREIGGAVVPMDVLAKDYLGNLEQMAAKIKSALEGTK